MSGTRCDGLRLEDELLGAIVLPFVVERRLMPRAVDDVEPFTRPCVTIVVLVESRAVTACFVLPPRRNHVEREPAVRDAIDVRRLLGENGRRMERGTHRDHDLEPLGDRGERGGRRPGVERWCLDAFDVVEQQLGDEGDVVTDLFAALRQPLHILPRRHHPLVFDITQPAAEDGKPVAVPHGATSTAEWRVVSDEWRAEWESRHLPLAARNSR